MTKDEVLWGNIRFFLLLAFSVALIFIVICRYVLDVPTEDSSELIHDINYSEHIFDIQRTHAQRANVIWSEIDSLDFNTHQVQRMDEVKEAISQLQYIYRENNLSTKFLFGVLSSKTLKFQFDTREELSSLEYNNALIERDLEECKANL